MCVFSRCAGPWIGGLVLIGVVHLLCVSGVQGQSASLASAQSADSHLYSPEAGPIPKRYVGREVYDAHKQNWDAVQDTSGVLYVANTQGVLTYDGHTWHTVPTGNRSIARSVALGPAGRVFVGAQRDLGMLRRDSLGRRHYVSLLDYVPEGHRSFTDVWRTEATSDGVYFQTRSRLFRWTPGAKAMHVWKPDSLFQNVASVRDRLYAGVNGQGLMVVQGDSLQSVPGGDALEGHFVKFVLPHGTEGLLVGTGDALFVRRGDTFRRLSTGIPDQLRDAWIYKGIALSDGTVAVATVDAGLFLFAPDGTLRRHLSVRDAPVTGLYTDHEGGLWALLDGGLLRYDFGAPFTEFRAPQELDGSVQDVVRHQGTLYVTTLQNTYRLRVPADTTAARLQRDLDNQSWTLCSLGDTLLAGTATGVFQRETDGTWTQLVNTRHAYDLLPAPTDSSHLYVATSQGVRRLDRTRTGWRDAGRVPGISTKAHTLAATADGTLWVGTSFDGVYRVRLSSPVDSTAVTHFGPDHGLPPDRVDPQRWNGTLVFGTSTGLMRFVPAPEPRFEHITSVEMPPLERGEGVVRLQSVAEGRAWGVTGWGPGRWRRRDTTWHWRPGALHRLRGRTVNALWIEDGGRTLWMATQEGLLRYEARPSHSIQSPPTRIHEVRTLETDSLLAPTGSSPPRIPFTEGGVRVVYGTSTLVNPSDVEYQYRRRGQEAEWSDWTTRTVRELPNLSPGTYTVEVRARTAYGDTTRTARASFVVMPPWYRTWWAYGGYVLLALGLVAGTVQWRTRRLRRRQEELEQTVAERTEQLREKNDQLAEQAERLQELDEAKSRFFANVSHEFRTPLTLIRGPVQDVRVGLEREEIEPGEGIEQLTIAERNVDRLRRLVDQILGLARVDAGSYELAARPIDLGAEVRRIARTYEPLAERHGLTFGVDATASEETSDDARPVYVDRDALEHILGNLLSNAIKFTPEGGAVDVTVDEQEEGVEVEVSDTGPGIPEDQQDTIFDRFAQGEEQPTGDVDGMGIGLAFAKDLVDLHGGTLALESTEGEGTTLTVYFPRGPDHLSNAQLAATGASSSSVSAPHSPAFPEDISTEEASSPDPPTSSDDPSSPDTPDSKVVLVVDDNADVRRYVRSVLAPEYEVVEAAEGGEGLEAVRDQLPDVILADVMMPGMDGHDMTRQLKDDPETEAIPVIMVTARAETSDEVAALEAGADDYVTKPFDADVLRARVDGMISVKERLRRRIRAELQVRSGDGQSTGESPGGAAGGDRSPDAAPPALVVPTASEEESAFVQDVRAAVEEHLADPDLTIDQLASAVAVSRSTLYRRLKNEIDTTPSAFIRQVRLEHGARLLRDGEGTVSEVAYAVGFNSLSYFSRCFREYVGQSPSEYRGEDTR